MRKVHEYCIEGSIRGRNSDTSMTTRIMLNGV